MTDVATNCCTRALILATQFLPIQVGRSLEKRLQHFIATFALSISQQAQPTGTLFICRGCSAPADERTLDVVR